MPILLFDVPFFATKKQQVKQIGKKLKYSQIIGGSSGGKKRFDFASEC